MDTFLEVAALAAFAVAVLILGLVLLKRSNRRLLLLLMPSLSLFGCDDPFGSNPDHSHDPWLQHHVELWRLTPDGHKRDGGPFQSVIEGWVTEEEIDTATDEAYIRFAECFPEFGLIADFPFSINDDYVMWASAYKTGSYGQWAGGVEFAGFHHIGVCLWSRISTPDDPGPAFIVRTPGRDQWGGQHPDYRHTGRQLLPALTHELLHAYIGDAQHQRPEWARVR